MGKLAKKPERGDIVSLCGGNDVLEITYPEILPLYADHCPIVLQTLVKVRTLIAGSAVPLQKGILLLFGIVSGSKIRVAVIKRVVVPVIATSRVALCKTENLSVHRKDASVFSRVAKGVIETRLSVFGGAPPILGDGLVAMLAHDGHKTIGQWDYAAWLAINLEGFGVLQFRRKFVKACYQPGYTFAISERFVAGPRDTRLTSAAAVAVSIRNLAIRVTAVIAQWYVLGWERHAASSVAVGVSRVLTHPTLPF